MDAYEALESSSNQILKAYVLCANDMQEFVVEPFRTVLSQIQRMPLDVFSDLVELISLTVHCPDVAIELIFECLEPASSRIIPGHPRLVQHFVRNMFGIALDHIDEALSHTDEAKELQKSQKILLDLKLVSSSEDYPLVESELRIDAPAGIIATSDHVRLKAASAPMNHAIARIFSTDALVVLSEPGLARFRCFRPLPSFIEECSWELQSCGSFATTKTMLDAVSNLACSPEDCSISDLLLGTQTKDYVAELSTKLAAVRGLNPSQNKAVEAAISSPVTCLWGPPGTGKTHTIVEIIKQLQSSGDKRILVTAPTHNAVDNVMEKYLASLGSEEIASRPTPLRVSNDVSIY